MWENLAKKLTCQYINYTEDIGKELLLFKKSGVAEMYVSVVQSKE